MNPPPCCPKCHGERVIKHCEASAGCKWWICVPCRIRYDSSGKWMEAPVK